MFSPSPLKRPTTKVKIAFAGNCDVTEYGEGSWNAPLRVTPDYEIRESSPWPTPVTEGRPNWTLVLRRADAHYCLGRVTTARFGAIIPRPCELRKTANRSAQQ